MKRWAAAALAVFVSLFTLCGAPADERGSYPIDLGTKTLLVIYKPIISANGQNYIALDLLKNIDSYRESKSEPKMKTGPQPQENISSTGGDAISVKPPVRMLNAERAFELGGTKYSLGKNDAGEWCVFDKNGDLIGSNALAQGTRIYLAYDTIFEMGMALSYAPETGNMRLLGVLTSVTTDGRENTLTAISLLPSRAAAFTTGDGFRVVLEGVFVKENYARQTPEGKVQVNNLAHHRLEIKLTQDSPTGYKLYPDRNSLCTFRVHLGNHFSIVSIEETSSGEAALTIAFTRPVNITTQILQSPPRLVLDFAGTVYDDATKYIDVKIGGVRQVRVGQFTQNPPVVRAVIEMSHLLDYRILKQGDGEKYYVQLLGERVHGAAIMLDAGHGGSDTGAVGVTGVNEKDIVLGTSQQLERKLEGMGYKVVLTRSDDSFMSLGERADYANSALPMIFISIHANSIEDPMFTGVMTFHYEGSSEGTKLASAIQRALLASTSAVDRGVRTANFFVLRETVVPAVLVEIGFLTNSIEEYKLRDPSYQQRIVDGVAAGIDEYMRTFGGG
jgi:N-acetylmuramoyl-L-alanine amidase